jgi:tetratricopeptide (TPR) repeat protein
MTRRSTILIAATTGLLVVTMFAVLNAFGRELNSLMLRVPGIDKGLHFAGFAVAFVLLFALARRADRPATMAALLATAGALVLSLSDEAAQSFFPGRNVEAADLIADWSGIALGWVLVGAVPRRLAVPLASAALVVAGSVTYASYVQLKDYSNAIAHLRRGEFYLARGSFLKALEAGHRTAAVYNGLSWADVESERGDPQKAVEWARTALEMTPDDPNVLDTYGWALHNAGRSAEALAPLERAFAAMPDMFCIHYHLGSAYLAVGRRVEAARHFREQLRKTGTREAARAERALLAMSVSR